jgi:hypothetical protein
MRIAALSEQKQKTRSGEIGIKDYIMKRTQNGKEAQ